MGSLWRTCSSTCYERQVLSLSNEEQEDFVNRKRDLSEISIVLEYNSDPRRPKRSRTRTVIKEEKHGGECKAYHIYCMNTTAGVSIKVDTEEEPCEVWSAHEKGRGDLSKYPVAVYPIPNEEKNVIPFCPIHCRWHPWRTKSKCDEKQKELGDQCYFPETLSILHQAKSDYKKVGFRDNYKILAKAFQDIVSHLDKVDSASSELPADLIGCLHKNIAHRKEDCGRDVDQIKDYMKTIKVRYAELPNLCGLFGGAACKLLNGKELTYKKVPANDSTRVQQFSETIILYECSLCLTIPAIPAEVNVTTTTPGPRPCLWWEVGLSEWGAWSECRAVDCGKRKIAHCMRDGEITRGCRPNWRLKTQTEEIKHQL